MSDDPGKLPPAGPRFSTPSLDDSASRAAASGRPTFDARGGAVWEWKTETGHFSRDVSTTRVQKLQAPELNIEQTVVAKKADVAPAVAGRPSGDGFDPYDRMGSAGLKTGARRTAVARPPARPIVRARPVTLLGRLQAWLARK